MSQKQSVQSIIFSLSIIIFSLLTLNSSYAATTEFRSAGWVATDGSPQYSTLGCKESNDDIYCSRANGTGNAGLFFGSFGNLEDFGIPLNSSIDKLHIRIKGKNTTTQYINVINAYNKMPWSSSCQTPSDLWAFYLGPVENTIEKHTSTAGNGLTNCIVPNNINFRNLTFRIASSPNPSWTADIDNFEVAFDYTPPSVTLTPADFPENQKGTIWEIGPDKSNIKKIDGFKNIVNVATGTSHTLALKVDGTVWAWGSNQYGQLGNGTSGNSSAVPVQVKGLNAEVYLTDIKAIAAGLDYSLALKKDGTVWTWGNNTGKYRGLGNDVGDSLLFPTQITSAHFSEVIAIAAGRSHSLALNADGTIVSWGFNGDGQLGIGCFLYNCSLSIRPAKTQNIDNVKEIAAGDTHSFAVKNDGSVWGWGSSQTWRLGDSVLNMNNTFSERPLPVQIPELQNIKSISSKGVYSLAITNDNDVLEWGGEDRLKSPRQISGITDVSKISAGTISFSYGVLGHAIKGDGSLWQIYINDIAPKQVSVLENVTAVASGNQMPSVAIIGTATDVLGENTGPAPFLDLPWDYQGKGISFNDAALAINSYFDHSYPLLSISSLSESLVKSNLPEAFSVLDQATTFGNLQSMDYSTHDGYDYGTPARVEYKDIVKAAASGLAIFTEECEACGNAVHINHPNGYQTRYYHLDQVLEKIHHATGPVEVIAGEQIGTVGYTGRVIPQGENGAHIHFMVIKDMNGDNQYDYTHDIPYGITDPFGWSPSLNDNPSAKDKDPWEEAKYLFSGQEKVIGNKSNYLWLHNLASMKTALTTNGVEASLEKYKLKFLQNSTAKNLTLYLYSSPMVKTESAGKKLQSVGSALKAEAYDVLGDLFRNFLIPFTMTVQFNDASLYNINPNTLSVYSSNDSISWVKENTLVDLQKGTAAAQISHFTYFALMGELADTVGPTTELTLSGTKGADNWYSSDVSLSLDAEDNAGGLGIQYTSYANGDEEWESYNEDLTFSSEGKHTVHYYSEDKGGNVEDAKITEFHIDKTAPLSVASVSGVEGLDGWLVSDGLISLSATDNGVVDRIEYSLDGGGTYLVYSEPFGVSHEGSNDILYRSVDKAGNVEESKTVSLKIDKMAPESMVYTTGLFGDDGWYRSDVSVSFNASDSVSGFDETFYSLDGENFVEYIDPLTIVDEGSTEITYYAVDNAGNKESQKTITIKIDKTAPEAEITYDLSKFDVIVMGKDNFSEVKVNTDTSSKLNPKYTLTDLAGNTLVIVTGELQIGKQVTQTLKTLKYNNNPSISLDRNIFFTLVFADRNNVVKQLDQYVSMKGDKRIFTNYSSQTNTTKIFTKNVGATEYTRVDRQGVVLLKLYTEKGVVKYTY